MIPVTISYKDITVDAEFPILPRAEDRVAIQYKGKVIYLKKKIVYFHVPEKMIKILLLDDATIMD